MEESVVLRQAFALGVDLQRVPDGERGPDLAIVLAPIVATVPGEAGEQTGI